MLPLCVFKPVARTFSCAAVILCLAVTTASPDEPKLNVVQPQQPVAPGKPFTVTYEISWNGKPADWAIAGPAIESLEWGSAAPLVAEAHADGDLQVIAHRIAFTPHDEGTVQVPAVNFTILDPEAATPPEMPKAETDPPNPDVHPTLRAQPFSVTVRAQRTLLWLSGGLGAFFIALGGAFVAIYRARRKVNPANPITAPRAPAEAAAHAIHLARRHRLDGRFYECLGELANAAYQLGDHQLVARLRTRSQEIGYQGLRPLDEELDGTFRDLERLLRNASGPSTA